MKKILNALSVLVGIFTYGYIVTMTARGTGDGLSFSTFGLWSALAWITGFCMLKKNANPAIPMIYGAGATATTVVLVSKGKFGWAMFDTAVLILVVICVILWLTSGPKPALIFSVLAAAVAGCPFLLMTWSHPAQSPIIPNSGFLAANALSFVSAKAWTMQDRLYSGVNIIVCALLVIPWLLQYLR